jgi:hypothetical protein
MGFGTVMLLVVVGAVVVVATVVVAVVAVLAAVLVAIVVDIVVELVVVAEGRPGAAACAEATPREATTTPIKKSQPLRRTATVCRSIRASAPPDSVGAAHPVVSDPRALMDAGFNRTPAMLQSAPASRRPLRLQPSPLPTLAAAQVLEPVVHVVLIGDPKLEPLGPDAVAAPMPRPLRLLRHCSKPLEQRLT